MWLFASGILMILDSVSAFWLYLTLFQWILMILDSGILMTLDSAWLFISISGNMWLFANVFWWYLTLCECILIIHDSLLANFDDTGLCQCNLMILDSVNACCWNLSLSVYADTWPSVYLTLTDFINKTLTRWSSWHFYSAPSLAAGTNAPLILETDARQVSSTALFAAPQHCRFIPQKACIHRYIQRQVLLLGQW